MTESGSAKTKSPSVKNDGQFPLFDPAEFARLAGRNMEVASRAARACFNGATKFNQEMVEFVNERVRKDFESAQAFMTSKNSEEALHAQAEFMESAFRDYAEEATKMFHVAADIAKETLTPPERRDS